MHAQRSVGVRAEPNVTPMIDVMLVLLIIFMTVAPLLDTGMVATPPTARHPSEHPDDDADAVIGIDVAGRLFFNKEPVTESALRARLHSRFASRSDDRVVYLRADRGLSYEAVQDVMTIASAAGASVVGLITEAVPPNRP
jgi:biopolymer transport protein ExbD